LAFSPRHQTAVGRTKALRSSGSVEYCVVPFQAGTAKTCPGLQFCGPFLVYLPLPGLLQRSTARHRIYRPGAQRSWLGAEEQNRNAHGDRTLPRLPRRSEGLTEMLP
jgi:hypothetical protein